MKSELIERLSPITEEEQDILDGNHSINQDLYYETNISVSSSNVVASSKVLTTDYLIDMRPHVRFVHFPKHTHDFVEMIYMCQGSTVHFIDDHKITLHAGDLLLLNQHATQEILPASKDDIAINFIILPQFFDTAFQMMASADSPLRDFIISCLTENNQKGNYLYFAAADLLPVQNIMENLVYNMLEGHGGQYKINQFTVGLLFLTLIQHTDLIHVSDASYDQQITFQLFRYLDTHYKTASLQAFADENRLNIHVLGRILKKTTGTSFTSLLQQKRLSHACYLLQNTPLPITDIAYAVGYENSSFFHRLFRKTYGITPKAYRRQRT